MTNRINATVGCSLIGEFVDEGEAPSHATSQGEAIRPNVVANYVDVWATADIFREFTVMLKDGHTVIVRGHALKHEPHPVAGQDVFCVFVRTATDESLVAVFKGAEVVGIFHGDFAERKIA